MKSSADIYGYVPGGEPCPRCGKRSWPTKRDAKRIRARRPGRRLNVYRCGDSWHLGHLPDVVRHGDAGRDDIVNLPAARRRRRAAS